MRLSDRATGSCERASVQVSERASEARDLAFCIIVGMCVRVCVCACVHVRARAGARARAHITSLSPTCASAHASECVRAHVGAAMHAQVCDLVVAVMAYIVMA